MAARTHPTVTDDALSLEDDVLVELERRRRRGLSVTDMTAGIFRRYAKTPPPAPHEEKDAFEYGCL